LKQIILSIISFIFCHLSFSQVEYSDSISKDASFPGGKIALQKFLKDNLIIPDNCKNIPEDGMVYVRFMVEKDGKITSVKVDSMDANCSSYEMEAIRIVRLMPKWEPGMINGDTVRIFYTLPIPFEVTEIDEIANPETPNEPNWAGFELGMSQFLNNSYSPDFAQNEYWENQMDRSWHFNYNYFEYKFPIYKHFIGLTTGLGYSFRGFSFTNNFNIIHNSDSTYAIPGTYDYKRNKLTCHYISIPLLFEFSSKRDTEKNFYFSAGIIGSWKFSSYTFQRGTEQNGDNFSRFTYSNFNMNKMNLEATARFGYSYIGLYAGYQLTSFFQKNKTVGIYPFRVGLTINVDYFQE
jgi:protein TonB